AALGAAMAALALGLALVWSGATVRLTPEWSRWAIHAGPLAAALLLAALWEELAFRGLPLRLLADAVGPMTAMLLLAVGFGAAHAWNPHAGVFGTVNVALAAIWLSFAFFSAGGMALAWGLHFGWNAGLALLFDAPVSGYTFHVPAVEYQPGARAWVDGGAFGPEGGLAATIVLCAGTLALVGGRLRQPRAWFA
ncbi:MAG: CPBP family glutamic-type intramembrane protease, partial [Gemmatimonadales bacterium]